MGNMRKTVILITLFLIIYIIISTTLINYEKVNQIRGLNVHSYTEIMNDHLAVSNVTELKPIPTNVTTVPPWNYYPPPPRPKLFGIPTLDNSEC
jgi:hypothetical protein